jgi:hypothetical protein
VRRWRLVRRVKPMLCLGKLHKQGPVRLANIAVSLRLRQSVDLRAWRYFQPVLRVNLLRASTRCHSCSAIAVTGVVADSQCARDCTFRITVGECVYDSLPNGKRTALLRCEALALRCSRWPLCASTIFTRTGSLACREMQRGAVTVIEIRPFRNGWRCTRRLVFSPGIFEPKKAT